MVQSTRTLPSFRSCQFSVSTVAWCGTSSCVWRRICSRTISATSMRFGQVGKLVLGEQVGPGGMSAAIFSSSRSRPRDFSAEIMKVSSIASMAFSSAASGSSRGGSTRSTLFSASQIGLGDLASRSTMARTASVSPARASTISRVRSASCAPPQAAATMARSSRRRGWKMPGVSTRMIWRAGVHHHGADAEARGLRLGRDDRHLAAGQRIHQRRLAGIRRADHGDQAAACRPARAGSSSAGWGRSWSSFMSVAAPKARPPPPPARRPAWSPRRPPPRGPPRRPSP